MARAVVPIVVTGVIVWFVWRGVGGIDLAETTRILIDVDGTWVAASIVAALGAIACMGLYDVLALPARPGLGPRTRWRMGMATFAWSNFLTLGPLGGPALRLLLYRRAGMETAEVLRGVGRILLATACGLAAWVIAASAPLGSSMAAIAGRVAIAALLSPLLAEISGRIARIVMRRRWTAPPAWTLARMGCVSVLDWGLAATAFALAGRAVGASAPIEEIARSMLVGQAVGIASMSPGGLGSADAVWVQLLSDAGVDEEAAAAQAVVFRCTFYLTPWLLSLPLVYALLRRKPGPNAGGPAA